jgi:hypothetical protein
VGKERRASPYRLQHGKSGSAFAETAALLYTYGYVRSLQKRYTEAEEWMNKAMPLMATYWTQDHSTHWRCRERYAAVLRKIGKNTRLTSGSSASRQ